MAAALASQHIPEKFEKRVFRMKCISIFMLTFMKIVFNQYPLLIDLQIVIFVMVCCNIRYVNKYVEGHLPTSFLLIFAALNTLFMWITWLDRFSGNANFFYFQTIVYNFVLIVTFIQMFNGVITKTLKYQKEMEELKEKFNEKM